MKKVALQISGNTGQSLPMVMLTGAVLAIFSAAMLSLFQMSTKFMVKQNCIMMKQELAAVAIEQVIYKLQEESNWEDLDQLPFYKNYSHEFTTPLGTFRTKVVKGNLFSDNKYDAEPARQGADEFRTIGIRLKTSPTGCIGNYYAVVEKMKFGGPLVSKGFINLPCTDAKINDPNFYWGDIFSGNTVNGTCRIPFVPVAKGTTGDHEDWMPKVYSAADIYTSVGYSGGGRTGSYQFATTYDDMSPTAHCHPYSQFAAVPEIDLQSYKDLATSQGNYYGPAVKQLPGGGSTGNPNFIADGKHDNYTGGGVVSDVLGPDAATVTTNAVKLMYSLRTPSSVLFIDTTDCLPVRPGYPSNTYSGCVTITANTLKFYVNNTNQYMTNGMIFIQGALQLIGDNPSNTANGTANRTWGYGFATGNDIDRVANVWCPKNKYYPQNDDGVHYDMNAIDQTQSYLTNVKHNGLIYAGGELRIGGPRVGSTNVSNVCIYGSIYLGERGILSMETASDTPKLYVYFNKDLNFFSMQTNSIQLVSFSEISFLVPWPTPGAYN